MWSMYCIKPLGRIYRITCLGGQVASPRDKEGYLGITINPKLTISRVAQYTLTSSVVVAIATRTDSWRTVEISPAIRTPMRMLRLG